MKLNLYKWLPTTVRILISIFLLYKVYSETGIFTTIVLSLIVIGIEIEIINNSRRTSCLENHNETFENLLRIMENKKKG